MSAKNWWAVGGAVVVVAAFATAQQTGALWNAQTVVSGESMTSGTTVLVVGTGSTLVKDYAPVSGTWFGGTALAAGSTVQKPLVIKNGGTSNLQFALQSAAVSSTLTSNGASTSATAMALTAWTVANEAACPASGTPTGTVIVNNQPMASATTTPISLTAGSSSTWCLAATVNVTPDASTTSKIVFTFQATQVSV